MQISVKRLGGNVALIRMDRPKMNALSIELLGELNAAIDALSGDLPGAVVVSGGPRIFAAGADIQELQQGASAAARVADAFRSCLDKLAAFPRATIAAINGYALGGGLELALACDFRVVSASTKLGLPEIQLGVIPGGGGTQRLARLVGAARAKDMILTGRHLGAEEAMRIGLADRVVERGPGDAAGGGSSGDPVEEAAVAWAEELARGALGAQALAKRAVDMGLDRTLDAGLALERDLFVEVFGTEDSVIGITSFLESGPGAAQFTGR